jgi:trehalose-6-phosphate synthase
MAAARLTIVSNRLPVTVSTRGGRTRVTPSSGGLATGLCDERRLRRRSSENGRRF